ncbi:MAG: putative Ig domain-containing protein [Myxococcota bacterium]
MYRTTEVPRHDAPKPAQTSVRRRKKRAAGGIAAGLACAMAVALAPQSAEATLGLADCSEWAVFGGLWLDHDRHVDGTLILEEETSPGVWTLVESIPSDLGFIPAYLEFYIGGPFSAPLSAGRYRVRVEGVVYFNATEALTAAQKMSWPVADTWTYNYQEATPFTCGAGAPVITSTPILTATVSEGWSYQVTISDAPGDTHTYAAEPFPMGSPGGAVLGQNGLITWTPASWQVGPRIFGLSVTDQTGLNDIQIFLVDVRPHTNPPPVITPIGPQVVYVGDALRIQVDATDDYVGPLTYDLSTKPDGMTITSTGAISWLPDGDQVGTSTVVVTVTDYYDATSTEQFTVEVRPALGPNTPPTLSPIADIQVDQGSLLSVTATATDPDPNEQLTFSLSIAPPGVTIDSASGAIQWTPGQADVGSHPFEVSVTDRAGASVSTTFTVLVVEVNDPPFFTNAPPPSPIAVGVTFVFQLTASDPDPADAVTFVKLAGPAALTVSAAGLITWPTTGADLGTQNVQVAVRDTGGLEAVETYALTVNSTQIPPSLGTGLLENAAEDQAYQAQLTATDPDIGEVLQFSLSGAPAGMSVDGQTGTVTWRPTQAQVGLHSVTAIVTDSAGLTDQRLTVITVAEVNDAPEITSTPPTAATQGSE